MKKILILLVSFTLLFSCSDSNNAKEINLDCLSGTLLDGIVAFYPFNNGSLSDLSGNSYDLTNPSSATPGADRDGNPSCAFQFNQANNEYLKFTDPAFLNNLPNDFSISFWFKSFEETNDHAVLISRGTEANCPNTTGQWSVQFTNMILSFGANGFLTYEMYVPQAWHHVIIASTNSNVSLFLDGEESNSANPYCTFSNPTQNSGDLFLGKSFDGLIDDVIIYNRSLTPAERTQLLNASPCCD